VLTPKLAGQVRKQLEAKGDEFYFHKEDLVAA
jgi:hypothetical protein